METLMFRGSAADLVRVVQENQFGPPPSSTSERLVFQNTPSRGFFKASSYKLLPVGCQVKTFLVRLFSSNEK
jgi:hypothetical protein